MLPGLLAVLLFDLAGEAAARFLRIPLPGPVIGMGLFLAALIARRDLAARIERGASLLLRHMSLFFVPAGVGVLTQLDVIRAEWLPISVALVGSTLCALVAGAQVFAWAARRS
jgi:holin-like protein